MNRVHFIECEFDSSILSFSESEKAIRELEADIIDSGFDAVKFVSFYNPGYNDSSAIFQVMGDETAMLMLSLKSQKLKVITEGLRRTKYAM